MVPLFFVECDSLFFAECGSTIFYGVEVRMFLDVRTVWGCFSTAALRYLRLGLLHSDLTRSAPTAEKGPLKSGNYARIVFSEQRTFSTKQVKLRHFEIANRSPSGALESTKHCY